MLSSPFLRAPFVGASALAKMPAVMRENLVELVLNQVLKKALRANELRFLQDKWLLLDIPDAGLQLNLTVKGQTLRCGSGQKPHVEMQGEALTMAQMACKLVDPDTLFFRRKLRIRGNTELGLAIKNLIDDIEIESFPTWARLPMQEFAKRLTPREEYLSPQGATK